VKPAAQLAKSASMSKTGLFAALRGLLHAVGTGAPSSGAPARPGLRLGRRPVLVLLFSVCALIGALALGAGSAAAAATEFGEEGEHLGQFSFPYGVAVDNGVSSSHGDVYLADRNNVRIDKFTGLGGPLLAWGWHVNEEGPAAELQTCTILCQAGEKGAGAGEFSGEGPRGVAVDPASGDVYVVDEGNFRVEKFDPEGKFILTFGVQGTANGQFEWNGEGSYIAVGPGGNVYVGDAGRVQVFEPSGAFLKNISLASLSEERVRALAVDAAGDVFVAVEEVPGVHEFNSSGVEIGAFDAASEAESIRGLAFDEKTGDLYVGDSGGGFHVATYDSKTGKELASFGSNTVTGISVAGMAFASMPAPGALYVAGNNLTKEPRVFVFTPPPPGPLIEPGSEGGTPERHGAATFKAQINPEGRATTYEVEYITEEQFKADGETYGVGTKVVAGLSSITTELFEDHTATVNLPEGTLVAGETYHWRFVATDSVPHKTTGPDKILVETPPALIEGPWATEVTSTSATLAARINPEGASTSYRLQYGTSTAYGHTFTGNAGAGTEFVAIGGYHLQELAPNTTYHYRIVTENKCYPVSNPSAICTLEGADHTFTTRPAASEFALPDGRAWELVTPADTGGASLELQSRRQAASDGSAITYPAQGVPLGENAVSNNSYFPTQVLSRRGPRGWASQDINTPINPPPEGQYYPGQLLSHGFYDLFSQDLASAVLTPQINNGVLTSDALEGTYYLRSDANGSYAPLLTPANTPPGTSLMHEEEGEGLALSPQVDVLAGTPDLSHIVLGSPVKLTSKAVDYLPHEIGRKGIGNIYAWSGGRLQLVNILPNGKTDESRAVQLAGGHNGAGEVARAVSSDGRRVAWTIGSPYGVSSTFKGLFVRDMAEEKTVHVGGPLALYQTMSRDGSRVIFLERGELYVYEAGTPTDLTASHGPGEASAGVQESVSDVSEDGSTVYFVAKGVLSSGENAMKEKAVSGGDNLYLSHYNGGVWEAPQFIATLLSQDEHSWSAHSGGGEPELLKVSSRVSPNGRYLAFMSSRSLTGYDNIDANPVAKEARDEEVFLYDSLARRLVCASCDPTGARPHGVLSGAGKPLLVEQSGNPVWAGHWLAGSLPGWELYGSADTVYQPRYLSDSGRLFFNSPEALVPQDTNGLEDVYQYEPAGVGDCAEASVAFDARLGGCVNLISSGHSGSESAFMDASEHGEDVFFLTSDHLTTADADTGYDVWDAHVCSASMPCLTPAVSLPPCSSSDSCKPAPAAQPELFGAGPSETFSGAGNLTPTPVPPIAKPLTRAQKLAKALAACRKKKKRRRRQACERTAHKQYAAKPSRKANTIKRGGT
jgi:NHL repeat